MLEITFTYDPAWTCIGVNVHTSEDILGMEKRIKSKGFRVNMGKTKIIRALGP